MTRAQHLGRSSRSGVVVLICGAIVHDLGSRADAALSELPSNQ
jgi:hypothetical protein